MLPQNEEQTSETQEYSFSTGSAADYTKLLNIIPKPKQPYDMVDETEETQEIDDTQELQEIQNNTGARSRIAKKSSQTTAKFITNSSDRVISFLGNLFIGDVDDVDFSADADEKREIQAAWEEVFPDPSVQIPPWVIAVVCMVLIYGGKFQTAIRYKRAQEKIEAA